MHGNQGASKGACKWQSGVRNWLGQPMSFDPKVCAPACAPLRSLQCPGKDVSAAYRFLSRFMLPPGPDGGLSLAQRQMHLSTLR
jgi:hypothetical protein